MGNPREFPALRPAVDGVEQAFEWKLVVVTHDKVLPDVKGRQRIAQGRIDRINFFPQIGRLVQGFTVGIPGRQFQPSAAVAQAEFKGVVVRFSNGRLVGVAAEIETQGPSSSVDHLARSRREYIALPEGTARGRTGRHLVRLT
jgi:hypothetical protein